VGFSPDIGGGYATDGGEGRGHLPVSPTMPRPSTSPLLPPPHSPLAVRSVPLPRLSPALRLATGDKYVERPGLSATAKPLHFGLARAALASQSAPAAPAPRRLASFLRTVPAPFKGASKDLNPTSTATVAGSSFPALRLTIGTAMVVGGLSAGGWWRLVALVGAVDVAAKLLAYSRVAK
jgi:hypothetical protein